MIVIDLIKQQVLDADPKAIQQIYFTRNLNREENVNITMFFLTEKAKENILDFSQGFLDFWSIPSKRKLS